MKKDIKENNSKEIKIDNICAKAVIMLLLAVTILNVIFKKGNMSEKENRELAAFPEISTATVLDGRFMDEFETYAADHFAWRDGAVSMKAQFEKWMCRSENNGVYFAKDGYLISKPAAFDKENVDKNIDALKTLREVGGYDMTIAVVPTAYDILRDKLPAFAHRDYFESIKKEVTERLEDTDIKICDTSDILANHKDEYIYYRTDHHQTALGSYYVYSALCRYMGYAAVPLNEYNRINLSERFYGTTWSKASLPYARPDEVQQFIPNNTNMNSKVVFPLENGSMDGLYNMDNLKKKDKYTVYLDGNHGLTVINTNNGTGRSLAILKDSYAHSLVPFLTQHYEHIYMIDLRYYNDDIVKYLEDNDVSEMLVLYNAENFNTDISLGTVGDMALTTSALIMPGYGRLEEQAPVGDEYFTDAVFFGDSITMAHSIHSDIPAEFVCRTSLNTMTMDSDKSGGSSAAEELLAKSDAAKYYIMLGINEIYYVKLERFIERYAGLIDRLKEKNPDAVIYIESLLPIEERAEGKPVKKASIDAANAALERLAYEKSCYYLDINSAIAEANGYLADGSATDGVHFYGEAHEKWDEYLRNHAVPSKEDGRAATVFKLYSGGGKADIEGYERDMTDSGIFKDTLSTVNDNVTARLTGIAEGEALSGLLCIGSGSTAEEFAIFEAASADKAEEIAEKLKKHVESRKPSFETYKPAEMTKLNNPVIEVHGNVVMLCVSDNNKRAKEIMGKY